MTHETDIETDDERARGKETKPESSSPKYLGACVYLYLMYLGPSIK